MKKLLLNSAKLTASLVLFGLLFSSNSSSAQSTANYTFSTAATGSLASDLNSNTVDLTTGSTSLLAASTDDTASTLSDIGFDFWLMGTLYTQFSASDNGVISLGAQPATTLYTLPNGTTATIAPFSNDLRVGTNGIVRSKVVGTAPNRCLVIEYSNMMIRYIGTAAAGTGTFQVRLYETTGAIEYVYGAMTTNTATPAVYNVGFSVNTTANNVVTVNTTAHTASTSATITNNSYTASSTITSLNSASNGSRRFYRFSQTAPNAPTGLSFSAVGSTGMNLSWTDNATNELGYVIYYSSDNVTYSFLGQLAANSTGAVITGLNPGTLYYYKIHAVREGALSSALSGSQSTKGGVAFTTSGSFTVPCYVTSLTVEAWGGGGKGGDRASGNNVALAGGGGGAYSSSVLTAPFSSPYTVTVGAGSTTTAAGGDSWFGSTTTVLAKGGSSVADNSNTRGAGGLASAGFGTTKFNGGTGAAGSGGSYGGGGGSSAGSAAAGNFTNATTTQNAGALAPANGGDGGDGAVSGVAGVNGIFPGGGGGGGYRAGNGTTQLAGDGAGGQVIVSWTCPSATIAYTGGPFCKSVSSATVTITGTDARSTCSNTFSATPAGLSINATTGAINPSASTVGTYTVSYQLAAAGGCSAVNATVSVTIIDVPTIAAISTPAALCSGGSLNPTAPTVTSNGSTVSSQGWQLETSVGSGTFASLTVPYTVAFADNGKKIRYTATNGCGTTNSNQVTLTVNDVPTIAAISTPAALCSGGSLNPTAPTVTSNGSTVSSQGWQLETSVGSGTFASLTVPYTVAFADNGKKIRYTATNGCGTTNSNQVTLTINNVPTIAAISTPAALCSGGSLNPTAPTVTANGSTVSSQGWQLETAVGSGTFASLTVPYTVAFADNGKKIRYTATNGCGTTNSNQVTLTVNDVPTIAAISTPAALCSGGSLNPTAPTVTANGSTVSSQGWQLETSVGSGTFASLTVPYTVAFADNGKKIRYTATNGCGTTNSNQVTLTINNVPTIAAISTPAALCSGGSLNPTAPTVTANGSTVSSQGWQLETAVGSGTFASLTVPYTVAFADNGKKIRYTATNGCGTTNSNQVTLTINNVPTIAAISTPAALCSGGSLNPTAPTVTANGSTVSSQGWQLETAVGSGTFASLTVPYTVAFADNGKKIRYTATNGCGTTNSNQVALTVNQTPAITAMTNATCTGVSFTSTPANGTNGVVPSGTTYSWSAPSVTGGMTGGASGSGASSITGILTNPTTTTQTATYTVTPTSGSCTGSIFTLTVTINPNNTVSAPSSTPTVCVSTALTAITHTTTGATGIGTATGLPTGVTAAWASNTITISGTPSSSGTFNYTIPLTGGCGTVNATGTITVRPAFTAGAIGTTGETICYGGTPTLGINSVTPASGGDGSITYKWQANGVDIPGSNADTFDPPSGLTVTTTYRRFAKDNTCNTTFTLSSGSWVVTVSNTNTWTGSVSSTWTTVGNWSCGYVPTSATDVVIGSGSFYPVLVSDVAIHSLTLNSGTTLKVNSSYDLTVTDAIVNNGTLTLENNSNLLQVNNVSNSGSGSTIVKRNSSALKRFDYTLWSSPVTGQGVYAFSPFTFGNRFYVYRTTTNVYNNADVGFSLTGLNGNGVNGTDSNNVQFAQAKGYLIRMPWDHPTAATVWNGTFTGVPNNGDINFTMTNGGSGQRFNLVGNPYPSPISMTQLVSDNSANITGTLYFWRETNNNTFNNAYCSWAGGTFTTNSEAQVFDPNGIIRTGQGFFVEASGAATTLSFKNGQRSTDNANQFFKNSHSNSVTDVENNRFWLNLTNTSGAFCQMAAGYMTNATNGVDLYDGKNINTGDVLLNSIIDNTDYTIQGKALPFDISDVIPLSCKITTAGTYSITLDHVDGLFSGGTQPIILKDNLTSTEHNLQTGAYTFASQAGTFTNRFEIVYQSQLSNPIFTANSVVIYRQNNDFVINSGNVNMASVKVFDIRGRLLQEKKSINATQTTINGSLANEVLLVQITSEDRAMVTKKVIR